MRGTIGSREGSLLGVVDRTCTPMGSRLLADWIAAPLIDIDAINHRLDAVEELTSGSQLRGDVRTTLKQTFDLTRVLGRIATGRTGPRDLQQVARTLSHLPKLKARLADRKPKRLQFVEAHLHLCGELRSQLDSALADECPISASDGNFIRAGFDDDLDALRDLARGDPFFSASGQFAK